MRRAKLGCTWVVVAIAFFTPNVRAADSNLTEILDPLRQSNGMLNDKVRGAYLAWAEKTVLAQLAAKNQSVPADCLEEVKGNPILSDAAFASVYPPDPDILANYARLRAGLGTAFVANYRSLVIGAAVALRSSPVAPADEHDFYPSSATTEPADDTDAPEPADALSKAVAEFLKSQKLTALEVYKDASRRDQLLGYLRVQHLGEKQIDGLKNDRALARALKKAMIILGQRPAAREAKPDEVAWLKYLASIYESKPDSTPKRKKEHKPLPWPMFPMDRAPWPLLMPLSRPLPLGEARYIWEKFNGEHGPDRFHSYGPYRKWPTQILYELKPSEWHWDAWQDRIVHGGVCVVMCTITIDLHSALCVPSVHAGQPHHANLITYHYSNEGDWEATVDQAFAGGPDVTNAAWLFHDEPEVPRATKKHVGAEYHLGLAEAMNIGLRQYVDTRIAVNLFQALPAAEKTTIGSKVLGQAIHGNPFNPEPWYLLAKQTRDATDGLALARSAEAHDGDGKGKLKRAPAPIQYWRTLSEFVTREAILRHPMPTDEAAARKVYQFLKFEVQGLSADDIAPYVQRFGS